MTVYIGSSNSTDRICYHTRECRLFPKTTFDVSEEEAIEMGLEECSICKKEHNQGTQDWSYQKALHGQ